MFFSLLLFLLDYLLSSQVPNKDAAHNGSILPTLVTNITLALGVIILIPALKWSLGLIINEYTPNNLNNHQSFKAIFDAGHDLIYPMSMTAPTIMPSCHITWTTITTVIILSFLSILAIRSWHNFSSSIIFVIANYSCYLIKFLAIDIFLSTWHLLIFLSFLSFSSRTSLTSITTYQCFFSHMPSILYLRQILWL